MPPEVRIARGARAWFYQCPRCRRFRSRGPRWCEGCQGVTSLSPNIATFKAVRITHEIGSLRKKLRELKAELGPFCQKMVEKAERVEKVDRGD